MRRTVLVTGATGSQGGAVARELLKRGHIVRAMTRDTHSSRAKTLAALGAHPITGNFDDPSSLDTATRGADVVFAMGTPVEGGPEQEIVQGKALFNAAQQAGVGHIVYTSVSDADKNTGVPHFDSKYELEEYLAGLDVPYTILGPVAFMENTVSPWGLPELKQGRLAIALPADHPCKQIALANIAQMAVAVMEDGDTYHGKRIDLAGDDLSGAEMASIISEASGKTIGYVEIPLETMRGQNEDYARMFDWFVKVGYSTDIAGLKQDFPQVNWLTFKNWARQQNWSAIL